MQGCNGKTGCKGPSKYEGKVCKGSVCHKCKGNSPYGEECDRCGVTRLRPRDPELHSDRGAGLRGKNGCKGPTYDKRKDGCGGPMYLKKNACGGSSTSTSSSDSDSEEIEISIQSAFDRLGVRQAELDRRNAGERARLKAESDLLETKRIEVDRMLLGVGSEEVEACIQSMFTKLSNEKQAKPKGGFDAKASDVAVIAEIVAAIKPHFEQLALVASQEDVIVDNPPVAVVPQAPQPVVPENALGTPASECCICSDAPRDTALIPCGHKHFCQSCVQAYLKDPQKTCPICKAVVTGSMKIYD